NSDLLDWCVNGVRHTNLTGPADWCVGVLLSLRERAAAAHQSHQWPAGLESLNLTHQSEKGPRSQSSATRPEAKILMPDAPIDHPIPLPVGFTLWHRPHGRRRWEQFDTCDTQAEASAVMFEAMAAGHSGDWAVVSQGIDPNARVTA